MWRVSNPKPNWRVSNNAINWSVGFVRILETTGALDITTYTEKTDLHNDDLVLIADSENSFTNKKVRAVRFADGGTFT